MRHPVESVLRGASGSTCRAANVVALSLVGFVVTFALYAVGVFSVSGGVVFIPSHAAVVGMLAAAAAGLARGGLVAAWTVSFGVLYGFRADHVFLGLSYRPLLGRVAIFVEPESLAVYGIEAVIVGTIPFVVARGLRYGVTSLRE
ncbi:hypothetical protein [Halomarina rubra]|uniref:Uncharacterized protein n=1 Tax=Halomarina rubra TaxID=2071873 RepID=A0ABD6ASN9_9EURY|nr:hypothetical protein [Halomarina rubra]